MCSGSRGSKTTPETAQEGNKGPRLTYQRYDGDGQAGDRVGVRPAAAAAAAVAAVIIVAHREPGSGGGEEREEVGEFENREVCCVFRYEGCKARRAQPSTELKVRLSGCMLAGCPIKDAGPPQVPCNRLFDSAWASSSPMNTSPRFGPQSEVAAHECAPFQSTRTVFIDKRGSRCQWLHTYRTAWALNQHR